MIKPTVYAKWSVVEYTITYVLGNENATNPNTTVKYTVEDEVVFKYASSTIFDAWYLEDTFTTKITKIERGTTGNKTIYAKTSSRKLLGKIILRLV